MGTRVRKAFGRVLAGLLTLALLAALALGLMHRQEISDYFQARGFDPSPRVAEILDELDLTPGGERIFLASRPTVDGSQHFNTQCAEVDHSEEGHVLGCYTKERIRLFDVTDERVSDIVEVTAAHELLHAVFARLGEGERTRLSRELRDAYDELSAQDPSLKERMDVYEHLSPSAFANELHSVLGTEVRDLPRSLEQHYARWFADREALLDRFDAFHAVFSDLQQQAESLEAEMTALRADVERRNAEYDALVEQFNLDAADFRARNDRYEFSGKADEFNRIQADLAARRDGLQATLEGLQADIDRYNAMRDQLRELGQVSSELDQQLNSSLAPVG